MIDRTLRDRRYYRALTWVLLILGVLLLASVSRRRLTSVEFISLDDYVEYWSAARLNFSGGNPYDREQMAVLQGQAGRLTDVPVMMWNPPWTLGMFMPLSVISYPASRLLWLLINIGIIFLSADWIWRTYSGDDRRRWIAWVVTLTFGPALHVLRAGQISPLLLAGVVGFLYFAGRDRWFAAGICAALITVKPHLLYLLGPSILLYVVRYRRWSLLAGFIVAMAVATAVAWLPNPALLAQYLHAVSYYPPEEWATPTLGGVLRLVLGVDRFWLQFLPSAAGVCWFCAYWWRKRTRWNWAQEMPLLVMVSVATAAYGWTFDHVVLLIAVIPAAATLVRAKLSLWRLMLVLSYLAFTAIALFSSMDQIFYWWMAAWLLAWCLLVRSICAARTAELGL